MSRATRKKSPGASAKGKRSSTDRGTQSRKRTGTKAKQPTRKTKKKPASAKAQKKSKAKGAEPTPAELRRLTAARGHRMLERWRRAMRAEIANAVTHGIGAGMSIAGMVLLIVLSAQHATAWHVVGCAIFGSSLVTLYLASTLYHSLPHPRAKRVFRILDHSAIYVLIAGSYTPFTLVNLHGAWGWSFFGAVWGFAVLGVIFKSFFVGRWDAVSTIIYLLMGWIAIIAWVPIQEAVPIGGLVLLVLGGLSYTLGTIFYAWHRLPFHHAIWHLFVLGGSVLHYLAVLLYVIPAPVA